MKIVLKTSNLPNDAIDDIFAEEELEKSARRLLVSKLRWNPKVPRSRPAASYMQR